MNWNPFESTGNFYQDNAWPRILDLIQNGGSGQANYDIAMRNLDFQKENLDYQKALQEEIFNREDTSYQRTVEDMRNAGLNPLAMSGTNSAGEAIATNPLQNNAQIQGTNGLGILSQIFQIANSVQDFQIGMSKNRESMAMARIAENNADISTATATDKIKTSFLDNWQKEMMTEDLWRNTLFNREFNLFNGMDTYSKYGNMLKEYLGQGEHNYLGQWISTGTDSGTYDVWNQKGLWNFNIGENKQSSKGDIEQRIAQASKFMIEKLIGAIDFGTDKGSKLLEKILGL